MVVGRQLDSLSLVTSTQSTTSGLCCCVQVVVGRQLDSIFMVMEYMEHDLKGLSENMRQPFTTAEVRGQGRQKPCLERRLKGFKDSRKSESPKTLKPFRSLNNRVN